MPAPAPLSKKAAKRAKAAAGPPQWPMHPTTVYVTRLLETVDESALREAFSRAGAISELRIMVDKRTGASKGAALVQFEEESSLAAALALDGADGRTLFGSASGGDAAQAEGPGGDEQPISVTQSRFPAAKPIEPSGNKAQPKDAAAQGADEKANKYLSASTGGARGRGKVGPRGFGVGSLGLG